MTKGLHKGSLRKIDNPHQWMIDDARLEVIQQIRAEVERQAKSIDTATGDFAEGRRMEQRIILSVLSDLEKSERPERYNPVYDEAYLNEKIKKATESWKGVDVDAMLAECRGRDEEKEEKPTIQEQPVKIDIRKELASIEFVGVNDARDSETIARHFYELGRQSKPRIVFSKEVFDQYDLEQFINAYKPKVSEGLEDVADTLAEEHGFVKKPNCKPAKYSFSAVRDVFIEGVKAGAKWQMGKDLSSINKSYESGVVFGMNAQKEQDEKELSEKIAAAYQLGLADKEKQTVNEEDFDIRKSNINTIVKAFKEKQEEAK